MMARITRGGENGHKRNARAWCSRSRVCFAPLTLTPLRLPFLTPSCDANSRFPALGPAAAILKAPIRFFVLWPILPDRRAARCRGPSLADSAISDSTQWTIFRAQPRSVRFT